MSNPSNTGGKSLAETRRSLLALRERQRAGVRGTGEQVVPVSRDRALPLSYTQQRLWFLDQLAPGTSVYNAPVILSLRADLDERALGRALNALTDRHEILRTRYPLRDGVPYQDMAQPGNAVPLPVTDLTGADEQEVRDLVFGLAQAPFDLENGPVLRAHLVRVGAREHVLVLALHHIASDGWSMPIVVGELFQLYRAELTGEPAGLPELTVQYADYAVWQRGRMTGAVLDDHLAYWKRQLADLPTLDLPTDRARPAVPSQAGAATDCLLPLDLRANLNQLARAERVTLLTVVLSAFMVMLDRYTGQDDIVVGSVFSGRERPEIEPLIGFFANTVVLRCSTAGDPTFRELLARANETVLGAHFHQELPFGRLVDELRPERDPSRNPLFQTSFTLQHAGVESAQIAGVDVEAYPLEGDTARFDLAVQLTEIPEGIRLWAEYSTDLFDADRIERLFGHYAQILDAVVADPDLRLSRLPMLTEPERDRLTEVSGRTAPVPEGCLHELFESVADTSPDAVATSFDGHRLTYRELDDRANRLAWALQAVGVGPETVVGVLLDRGPELPTAFFGVQKAGGAYLPLDPDHPAGRWETGLTEARCEIVVTTSDRAGELPPGVTAVCVDDPALGQHSTKRPRSGVGPGNLAYMIFTSGSTGKPKGVQVEHRSIVNFTRASIEMFRLGVGDRVLQFANPSYDVSLFDFFSALCSGAQLVQASKATLLDPERLAGLMREEGVTVTDLPPAVLGLLDADTFPALRALFVGLEAFPGELVNRWNIPGREFHNGYGPTEATVACIDYLCPDGTYAAMPPIGTPMANYQAHVLDRYGNPVPVGVPGELFIGGVGVARGYAHQPGLTAERFVPDPFGEPGARLYRTGDLVRRQADGNLYFLGRVDNQIKIRGLRVEPGEIEHAVETHSAVAEAVVVAWGSGAEASLVCYLSTAPGREAEPEDLRRYLVDRLPAHLVPAMFVVLPELPRASSGKLDRKRLPEPGKAAARQAVAPSTQTELMLAEIWRELLDETLEIDVHDSFFSVGGNSLKVTQLASRIRGVFGVEVDLRDLFVRSTIAELAELIEASELDDASEDELATLLAQLEETP
ncbi:amino acid adenylation domain-containing protein [Streptomyces sp. NBC_01142]|uniref:non-ribosomal peptide synthetase n=1 Tax=Streptomyces sp. NBC_01142 TaxID=2975865 RepID=UPI00224DA7FA|nr:amino acid adenylation domain-containing protein [Streptomyces sp. NBC_01142]MCX4820776.1 amino acid adenylation domain-containing protein [Streptomyces sp. NBC_01142]